MRTEVVLILFEAWQVIS